MQVRVVTVGEPVSFQNELNSALKLLERTDVIDDVLFDVQTLGHPGHMAALYSAFIKHHPISTISPVMAEVKD